MNKSKICDMTCGVSNDPKRIELAFLLIRLAVAATFIFHGWQKIGAMDGTISFFASLGFSAIFAYIVAYVEFLGGLAMLAGIATRLVGALFAVIMVVAIFSVHLDKGFNSMGGGYEWQLLLLASSVAIALVGPGKWSAHSKICK